MHNVCGVRNARHSGRSLAVLFLFGLFIGSGLYSTRVAAAPGDILWRFNAPDPYSVPGGPYPSPSVAEDGTIYVGADKFYALQSDGSVKWSRDLSVVASPVIAFDGAIYVPVATKVPPEIPAPISLQTLNPDGTDRWRYYLSDSTTSTIVKNPTVGSGGTIYVPFRQEYLGAVQALRWDGLPLWSLDVGEGADNIIVGPEGNLFVYSISFGAIKSFRADGTPRWSRQGLTSLLGMGGDGTLYASSGILSSGVVDPYAGVMTNLIAIGDDGTNRWTFSASENFRQTPAIRSDGTVFAPAEKMIYCLDNNGTKLWEFVADQAIATPVALASDGDLFFGTVSNRLYTISSEGKLKRTVDLEPGPISAPILGNDGKLVIRSGNTLYAIDNGGVGPAAGGWPMARKNSLQTASYFPDAIVPRVPEWARASTDQYGVKVIWTNVPGATSYELWRGRSTNIQEATLLAKDIGMRTDYFDAEAGSAQTNYYWLRAKSGTVPGLFTEPIQGYSVELKPGVLEKKVATRPINAELAVSKDGSIFFSPELLMNGARVKGLSALNPDGTVRWSNAFVGPPSLISVSTTGDGLMGFVGDSIDPAMPSRAFGVYGFSASTGDAGLPNIATTWSSVALGADGEIYASTDSGLFRGIPTLFYPFYSGWTFPAVGVRTAPAIGPDGTIFFGAQTNFYAVTSDGTLHWKYSSARESFDAWPAVGADGRVYARSGTNGLHSTLYCLDGMGREVWRFSSGGSLSSPAIAADGTVYLGGGFLSALNPDGGLKWQKEGGSTNAWTWSAPTIGSDGTVYATFGETLYAFDATGAMEWDFQAESLFTGSPVFLDEGVVVAGSNGGLYFVKAATGSKWSPWPMAGHDPQRTFRALQRGLKVQKESDGVRLEMTMEKGKRYRLEASADLKDWTVMSDFVSTNTVMQFKDTSQERRFYRFVVFP